MINCYRLFILVIVVSLIACSGQDADKEWLSTPESIASFRRDVNALRPHSSAISLSKIEDRTISLPGREIAIRIYDPGGTTPQPVLIYIHGACWVAGSLDSHDEICRYLAKETGSKVIAIDYRLPPEYKYPAAHNDVYDTIRWIWENSQQLGIDKKRFGVGGESAGAYFAAATALRSSDRQDGPTISFLFLVYAALDGGGPNWPQCKNLYFHNIDEVKSRYGSPLWATDLSNMPPTFDIYGEKEISRYEQELFMKRLREQGVYTKSFMVKGVGHDAENWISLKGNPNVHRIAVEFLRSGFELGAATQ